MSLPPCVHGRTDAEICSKCEALEITDAMIVAARQAIERRQRSLVAKITKSSIRDALRAAETVRQSNG